ncbi:MAG: hypothetical protein CM15mP120_27290 [Pseudomonadota bacterium]|nr:MAG: hypothetical protein CM15mP120_27290 [Pseudomonadota bacterium]
MSEASIRKSWRNSNDLAQQDERKGVKYLAYSGLWTK